jgi:choline dehydrogenase-like flavoprotein
MPTWKHRQRRSWQGSVSTCDPLLTIETEAVVTRIRMENGKAVGVGYLQNGSKRQALAGADVILAAGAYQTSKLLMRSGIGPEDELSRHGIKTEVSLLGVGRNLQDHYECPVVATTKGAFGYYGADRGWQGAWAAHTLAAGWPGVRQDQGLFLGRWRPAGRRRQQCP